jgi:hypothetical protein
MRAFIAATSIVAACGTGGTGVIKEGYRSGDIIQYEIESTDGKRYMVNESETERM